MSKTHSNVAPGHYKVAGRERQGEDVIQSLHKARLAQSRAQLERAEQMPEQETLDRAERDKDEGKSPSTQAGEFVREEMHHIRQGKHGARSTKQAIAIGLSKARRAGVKLGRPKAGSVSPETQRQAARDAARGRAGGTPSPKRSRAVRQALKREGRGAASRKSLARQARAVARSRGPRARKASARKAARTRARARV